MAKERTFSIIKPDATKRNLTGKINALPTSDDVPFEVNMNLIIEFYR